MNPYVEKIEELVKEIQILKAKVKECEQDSEAYLDSAQHNMEVALVWKKEHEKLTKEVERLRASDSLLTATLQSYRNEHTRYRQIDTDNRKTFTRVHELKAEINETRLSERSEGWTEGWEAACRYHELSDKDACTGRLLHVDYDELKRENEELESEVAQLKENW
jgi:cell division protein FtsB